jgi:para-aminobenzoate synthetase/4-amino-4-deoxychorismate lyase
VSTAPHSSLLPGSITPTVARPRAVALGRGVGTDVQLAAWLRGQPGAIALRGVWAGGSPILSSHPLSVLSADADPFEALDRLPEPIAEIASSGDGPRPCVGGGWMGFLGFGLGHDVEQLTPPPPGDPRVPRFRLAFHDHLVRRDGDGEWWFEALWTEARGRLLTHRLQWWREHLAEGPPPPLGDQLGGGPLRPLGAGLSGHRAAVAEAVTRIREGELSQANICLALDGPFTGDPLDLWLRAASRLDPEYAAYISGEGWSVASLSPELFLRRDGRTALSRPIKGTAPIGEDPARLRASEKDRAENVMIVDLMRNDFGRVCAYGTVEVPELWAVRPAAGVHHLVSTVTGRLRQGVGDGDLLRATFPPGSVTGAPKIRALRVIHELEGSRREVYCGAIGIRSPLSGLELNVAIRTFEVAGGRIRLGVGGGIVADSDPDAEVAEAIAKARGVVDAAGLTVEWGASPAQVAPAAPAASVAPAAPAARALPALRLRRPEASAGVFETIRVSGGEPVRLDEHLARLTASCRVLGLPSQPGLASELQATALALHEGAVRASVGPAGCEIESRALPSPGATRLQPAGLPGGLGAHKWADRGLIDALSGPGVAPLFCELDTTVLEAGYAAVCIVVGTTLIAPPLDGRILPSVSRAAMLTAAPNAGLSVELRQFTLREARAADAVLLSSSLRGPHPGLLEGGPDGRRAGELCARLS